MEEAVDSAGKRYTPELHVDMPIAQDFELFARSEASVNRIKSLAVGIRRAFTHVLHSCKDLGLSGVSIYGIEPAAKATPDSLSALEYRPEAASPFNNIAQTVEEFIDIAKRLLDSKEQSSGISLQQKSTLHNLLVELTDAQSELARAGEASSKSVMVLRGEAGIGKTHLLCDVAKRRVGSGAPTILLMGNRFTSRDDPWAQMRNLLDLPNAPAEEIVGALEAAAEVANQRALLIIDALNESRDGASSDGEIWREHLAPFLTEVKRFLGLA